MSFSDNILPFVDISSLLFLFPVNIFIFIVNILDWKKKRTLQASDKIITGISVCNLVFGMVKLCKSLSTLYNITSMKIINSTIFLTAISCKIWFSACLCVHFCLKIVKIHHCFYIYLQRTFHKKLSWILVLSVVESVLVSPFVALYSPNEVILSNAHLNSSMMIVPRNIQPLKISSFLLFCIPIFFAIILFAMSSLTITYTLCRHIKVLRNNSQDFQSSTTEAHIRATITVFTLFFLCLMLVLYVTMSQMYFRLSGQKLQYIVVTLHFLFSILNYWALINGNQKLNKASREMMNCLIC
ncbi:hypothetical protein GDO78_020334, partial [Eleutherodactylus coqui]